MNADISCVIEAKNGDTRYEMFCMALSTVKCCVCLSRSFVFSPEVLIRLDYQGKWVDMEQGTLAGLIVGLAQLNCSELRLKPINHRHG